MESWSQNALSVELISKITESSKQVPLPFNQVEYTELCNDNIVVDW